MINPNAVQTKISIQETSHNDTKNQQRDDAFGLLYKRLNIINNKYYSLFPRKGYYFRIKINQIKVSKQNQDIPLLMKSAEVQPYDKYIEKYCPRTCHYSSIKFLEGFESNWTFLNNKIKYIRTTLSDGDSYYRSFIYSYFQNILYSSKNKIIIRQKKFDLLKQQICSIQETLANNYSFANRDFKVNLTDILTVFNAIWTKMEIVNKEKNEEKAEQVINETLNLFDKEFNNNNNFDQGLVKYTKAALSNYLKSGDCLFAKTLLENSLINPKYIIDGKLDQLEYIKDNIEQMQTSPSLLIVYLTSLVFQTQIDLFIEEKDCIMKKTFVQSKNSLITVKILYSQQKYSIVYDANDLEQYNNDIFLKNNVKSESQLRLPRKDRKCWNEHSPFYYLINDMKVYPEVLVNKINEALNERIKFFYQEKNSNFECKILMYYYFKQIIVDLSLYILRMIIKL